MEDQDAHGASQSMGRNCSVSYCCFYATDCMLFNEAIGGLGKGNMLTMNLFAFLIILDYDVFLKEYF